MSAEHRAPRTEEETEPRLRSHIVLCGSLRAGTTMLRLMLGQHSQVHGRGEKHRTAG